MARMTKKKGLEIKEHALMPEHIKLPEKEKQELIEKYNISLKELPKIKMDDIAIMSLNAKEGDIIKIIRKSATAGESLFYRVVISE